MSYRLSSRSDHGVSQSPGLGTPTGCSVERAHGPLPASCLHLECSQFRGVRPCLFRNLPGSNPPSTVSRVFQGSSPLPALQVYIALHPADNLTSVKSISASSQRPIKVSHRNTCHPPPTCASFKASPGSEKHVWEQPLPPQATLASPSGLHQGAAHPHEPLTRG